MCLTLRRAYRTPYNKSKIRYKVVRVSGRGTLWPPYQTNLHGPYSKRAWNTSDADKTLNCYLSACGFNRPGAKRKHASERGIHVFLSARDAKYFAGNHRRIYKIRVDGFLASGSFNTAEKSETWNKMKFIKRIA